MPEQTDIFSRTDQPLEFSAEVVTTTIRRLIGYGLLEEFERQAKEDPTMTVIVSASAINLAKQLLNQTGIRGSDAFVESILGDGGKGYNCPQIMR